jgi:hypothetical protein
MLKAISSDPWLRRENVLTVLREALEEANMSPDQIDAVAYTKVIYIISINNLPGTLNFDYCES